MFGRHEKITGGVLPQRGIADPFGQLTRVLCGFSDG
jgi:hypothetical protein